VVSDNIRKGAALTASRIAEVLIEKYCSADRLCGPEKVQGTEDAV